ncbi:MAG TPA: hypothetical protein VH593_08155 [Ktedonobacteraceae bacterium]
MCIEADESDDEDRKAGAVQTLFSDWFPGRDGWKRLYPSGAKELLRLMDNSALAVYEALEDSPANPELRDDTEIRTRDPLIYCKGILKNKRRQRREERQEEARKTGQQGYTRSNGKSEETARYDWDLDELWKLVDLGRQQVVRGREQQASQQMAS